MDLRPARVSLANSCEMKVAGRRRGNAHAIWNEAVETLAVLTAGSVLHFYDVRTTPKPLRLVSPDSPPRCSPSSSAPPRACRSSGTTSRSTAWWPTRTTFCWACPVAACTLFPGGGSCAAQRTYGASTAGR
ncbi:hypothetical protein CLOP_g9470 [Closterium sp. NIES-67]|nr:hypothetical protein CLOP_g9470 [Closterium sp. NIES-67]